MSYFSDTFIKSVTQQRKLILKQHETSASCPQTTLGSVLKCGESLHDIPMFNVSPFFTWVDGCHETLSSFDPENVSIEKYVLTEKLRDAFRKKDICRDDLHLWVIDIHDTIDTQCRHSVSTFLLEICSFCLTLPEKNRNVERSHDTAEEMLCSAHNESLTWLLEFPQVVGRLLTSDGTIKKFGWYALSFAPRTVWLVFNMVDMNDVQFSRGLEVIQNGVGLDAYIQITDTQMADLLHEIQKETKDVSEQGKSSSKPRFWTVASSSLSDTFPLTSVVLPVPSDVLLQKKPWPDIVSTACSLSSALMDILYLNEAETESGDEGGMEVDSSDVSGDEQVDISHKLNVEGLAIHPAQGSVVTGANCSLVEWERFMRFSFLAVSNVHCGHNNEYDKSECRKRFRKLDCEVDIAEEGFVSFNCSLFLRGYQCCLSYPH